MKHGSGWEAAAQIGRDKRNLMGSSRTIKIEIPRVQSDFICYLDLTPPSFSHTLLFVNYDWSMVIPISYREKNKIGPVN